MFSVPLRVIVMGFDCDRFLANFSFELKTEKRGPDRNAQHDNRAFQ